MVDGLAQALVQTYLRRPFKPGFSQGDIRAPHLRVVNGQRLVNDPGFGAGQLAYGPRDFKDGQLPRGADIDRSVDVAMEQLVDALNQIRHITEAAGLIALAVNGQGPDRNS